MKTLAILAIAALAACAGNGQPMSAEDKALAVMLFARPSYTPSYQPVQIYTAPPHWAGGVDASIPLAAGRIGYGRGY